MKSILANGKCTFSFDPEEKTITGLDLISLEKCINSDKIDFKKNWGKLILKFSSSISYKDVLSILEGENIKMITET